MSNETKIQECVIFRNKGEIDVGAITTLGVSVKEGAGAIGMFGTGLKYSIAVALREGLKLIIRSGRREYVFSLREQRIRGEHFQIVHMTEVDDKNPQSLHFTTAYGRNWTLQQVYRELWSNMKDEGGWVDRTTTAELPPPLEGETQIIVVGKAFAEVHADRYDFLLSPTKQRIASHGGLEVYLGGGHQVFYRGIAALKTEKHLKYTYNITSTQTLTEDRTLANGTYYLDQLIRNWILICEDQGLIEDFLITPEPYYEAGFYFSQLTAPGETFTSAVKSLMETGDLDKINSSAKDVFFFHTKTQKLEFNELVLNDEQAAELSLGIARVRDWGFDYEHYGFKVKVVEDCGVDILARVNGDECLLTLKCIEDRDLLDLALVEEFIHLRDRVSDCTRQMQHVLFREIVKLCRRIDDLKKIDADFERIMQIAQPKPEPEPDDEIPF